jgi:hypothetical protein
MKSQINGLFTKWECAYILDLDLESEVHSIWDLWSSGMQGQCFFLKLSGAGNNFLSGSKFSQVGAKKIREGCPARI